MYMKFTAKILFGGLFMGVLLLACHTSSPNKGKTTTSSADSAYISFSLDCPQSNVVFCFCGKGSQ